MLSQCLTTLRTHMDFCINTTANSVSLRQPPSDTAILALEPLKCSSLCSCLPFVLLFKVHFGNCCEVQSASQPADLAVVVVVVNRQHVCHSADTCVSSSFGPSSAHSSARLAAGRCQQQLLLHSLPVRAQHADFILSECSQIPF